MYSNYFLASVVWTGMAAVVGESPPSTSQKTVTAYVNYRLASDVNRSAQSLPYVFPDSRGCRTWRGY